MMNLVISAATDASGPRVVAVVTTCLVLSLLVDTCTHAAMDVFRCHTYFMHVSILSSRSRSALGILYIHTAEDFCI